MKPTAIIMLAAGLAVLSLPCAVRGADAQPAAAKAAEAKPAPESILEVAYALTWQTDPRYKGRNPFTTVLTTLDGSTVRKVSRLAAPRTPSEELAFVEKAQSLLAEAEAAIEQADYKAAGDNIDTVRDMAAMPMVTQIAKDKMEGVSKKLADLQDRYGKMRARAALATALQLAARMNAYFETERYGEVISAQVELDKLNDEKGLKNPEVAETAQLLLAKCVALKDRALIHIEFAKKDLRVDAVSHFPGGRSYAIINGEVLGEGALVAPELTLAAVASGKVTFDYRGEKISQGLAEPEASQSVGKSGKEGMTR